MCDHDAMKRHDGSRHMRRLDRRLDRAATRAARAARRRTMAAATAQPNLAMRDMSQQWLEPGSPICMGWHQFAAAAAALRRCDGPVQRRRGNLRCMAGAWASVDCASRRLRRAVRGPARVALPPIGLAREHTEAWRELAAAHAECQRIEQELRARAGSSAVRRARSAREARRRARAAEQAHRRAFASSTICGWSAANRSSRKSRTARRIAKLQARARQCDDASAQPRMQTVIEQGLKQFDLPTRSELNTVHQQVRELRLQRDALHAGSATGRCGDEAAEAQGEGRDDDEANGDFDKISARSRRSSRSGLRADWRRWPDVGDVTHRQRRRRTRCITRRQARAVSLSAVRSAWRPQAARAHAAADLLRARQSSVHDGPAAGSLADSRPAAAGRRCLSHRLGLSRRRRSLSRAQTTTCCAICLAASTSCARPAVSDRSICSAYARAARCACAMRRCTRSGAQPDHDGDAGRFSHAGEPADQVGRARRPRCAGRGHRQCAGRNAECACS